MRSGLLAFSMALSSGLLACSGVITREAGDAPDPVETPGKSPVDAASCDFGASAAPHRGVLAWVSGRDVVMVRGDGSSFVPFSFGEGVEAPSVWAQIASKGGYVAVTGSLYTESGGTYVETVLLSAEGKVLWTSGAALGGYAYPYLGPEGTLAIATWAEGIASTEIVWPSGETAEVKGIVPIGAPSADGRFPALLTPDSYIQEYGWGEPGAPPEPLAFPAYFGGSVSESDGVLFYVGMKDESAEQLFFVTESEEAITSVPLTPGTTPFVASLAGPFALVRTDWDFAAPQLLSNSQSGALTPVAPPTDLHPFGMAYYDGLTVDDQGGLWVPSRTGAVGGFYRTTDFGQSFQRMGKSFSNVWSASVVARNGTFVLAATDMQGYFPMDPWEQPAQGEAPPDVVGANVQVIRPADGIARSLPSTATGFALDEQGACLAFVVDDQIYATSVPEAAELPLGKLDPALGFSFPVWIE